ncbi:MAG: ATP-dependent DNA ligase [Nocardioidaceae bacterium]
MLLTDLVDASARVAGTRSRTAKVAALAHALTLAATGGSEQVLTATAYLSGVLRQRRTGLGHRALQGLPDPAPTSSLEVVEVHQRLEEVAAVSGSGSRRQRAALVDDLFGLATAAEQRYLRDLVTGGLRQGALDGLVVEAVAVAAGLGAEEVRRASMLAGSTLPVAAAALTAGRPGLTRFTLRPGHPVRPMLASSAPTVAEAMLRAAGTSGGAVAVDTKLDGIRVQVHKHDGEVRVFTRSLEDITDRVPEVVEAVAALPTTALVLDGEAIALTADGRARPFQETGARTAGRLDVATLRRRVPLTSYYFDVLHLDGEDLLDRPGRERFARLAQALPPALVVPRAVTADPDEGARLFAAAIAGGHEGVVLKSLTAPYDAGRRGAAWVKVKPRHTLDLVVLAVEWGSGRRQGLLSNLHLGARDPDGGGFVMLGKTFKGMTDEMLTWQTGRFLEMETHREGHVVHVRPEQVVEVAFDGVQRSTRYPGGVTLRFARVKGYRDDKAADEADTVDAVRGFL